MRLAWQLILAVLTALWLSATATVAAPSPAGGEVFAFYEEWLDNGIASLNAHRDQIDVLMPDWLELDATNGVVEISSARVNATLQTIAAARTPPRLAPVLSYLVAGQPRPELLAQLLGSAPERQKLVAAILAYVEARQLDGITVSLWFGDADTVGVYAAFAAELHEAFHPLGLEVFHTLPMTGAEDLAPVIATYADAIIVLDDTEPDAPGPLADQRRFADGVDSWTSRVPDDKLVFGLFNGARNWNLADGSARNISVLGALSLARDAGVSPAYDPASGNSVFDYQHQSGAPHRVWMLDAAGSFEQLHLLAAHPVRGIALPRLGSADPSIWALLDNLAQPDADALRHIDASYVVNKHGSGEAVTLSAHPHDGRRTIKLSPDGRSVAEASYVQLPRGFDILHGDAAADHMIALTFDDGPDPVWTPKILDILASRQVPATFFAIGSQMMKHPDLVRRMVAEGHEVGNHTYSHTNVSVLHEDAMRLELSATQAIFESITGRNMAMFRPPYAIDSNPQTPEEIGSLALVSELGYLTLNMNIDPRDWEFREAREIVDNTMREARAGVGHVVLLHDGGGNRAETVAALPEIIDQLRAEGFQLVPASRLLGFEPDDVMPLSSGDVGLTRTFNSFGYTVLREGQRLFELFFVLAVSLGIARALFLIGLSFLRRKPSPAATADIGRVGVVIAAYNEEKVIVKTIESLLASTYPDVHILVVDDGSRDNTYALCRTHFAGNPAVEVITQPNGGKAAALNTGFAVLDTDIVIGLDADTIFLPDTIARLVAHFSDPEVAAVSGNAKVGNRGTVLTKLQALEYITAQNLDRRAFDVLNCITVVPGAVGAWRRDLVLEAGGYLHDTLAEDADLTIRLIRNGYRVTYEDGAIALTEAPQTVPEFLKQRFRWMFGMMQVGVKHLGAMRLRDSKSMGLIAIPNIMLFQVLFPLVAPVADLLALGVLTDLAVKLATNSNAIYIENSLIFLGTFLAFVLVDFTAAAIAFMHERRENPWLLLWILPQRVFYRQLIYLVAIRSLLSAIRGSTVGWGSLKRSASVSAPAAARWLK